MIVYVRMRFSSLENSEKYSNDKLESLFNFHNNAAFENWAVKS